MCEHNGTQKPRKSGVRKLDFLEQTILDVFRWQEAQALSSEQQKAAAKSLRTRLADLRHLVMSR
jgi:hypothetical protein